MQNKNDESTQYKTQLESTSSECTSEALPYPTQESIEVLSQQGLFCPNCGDRLEGRKCKLLCLRPGCGYMVTCSEW
jgi:hypothetical protein